MTDSIRTAVEGAQNVLLLAPVMSTAAAQSHRDLLTVAAPERESVLAVTYRTTPDRWLADWQQTLGDLPANVGVIGVSDTMRSSAAGSETPTGGVGGTDVRKAVRRPTDLTGLGITVSEYLKAWHDTGTRIVACFDSLTAILQYGELSTVYRFLHVLTNRLSAVDALGHYHLDPAAADEQTISRLKSLFDASIEFTDDEWTVSRR